MESAEAHKDKAVVEVDLVEHEYLAAVQSANRRLLARQTHDGWRRGGKIFAVCLLLGVGVSYAMRSGNFDKLLPWLLILGVGFFLLSVFWQRKRLYRRLLEGQAAHFRLELDDAGLRVINERGEFLYGWPALDQIERRPAGVHVHLKGFQVLWVPERCFADQAAFHAFVSALQAGSGLALVDNVASTFPVQEASGRYLSDLKSNLVAGVGFLLLRRDAPALLRPTVGQFIALIVLAILLGLLVDVVRVEGPGQFEWSALPASFYGSLLMLLTAWGASCAEREARSRLLPAVVALSALWLMIDGLSGACDLLPWRVVSPYSPAGVLLRMALVLWGALASVVALVRVLGLLPESRVAAILAVVYLLILPAVIAGDQGHLWVKDYSDEEASSDSRRRWEAATREEVLYAQPRLLDEALARIKPGVAGVPELFFLGVAGHGEQDVFRREVMAVGKQFDKRFQASEHGVLLVNNPDSVLSQPMASVTALRQSLRVIGKRMNPEDVLFLFMTSHGSAQHRFDLSLWPYRFDDLTPEVLRRMLDEAGIRYRVVVVSACYSGGFVRPLANPDTLVITAARADRNSHGCSHAAEWTFFGKAFFDEALLNTTSFIEAFEMARDKVAEREKTEGLEASEPQMAVGEGIRQALKALERRLVN